MCVGITLRKDSNLLVLPITTLDHSCGYLLLLLQPSALQEENKVSSQHLTAHLVPPPEVLSFKTFVFYIYLFCVCIWACLYVDIRGQFESVLPV